MKALREYWKKPQNEHLLIGVLLPLFMVFISPFETKWWAVGWVLYAGAIGRTCASLQYFEGLSNGIAIAEQKQKQGETKEHEPTEG
jgi:hypothetical protein